jgi:hypothetical protein
MPGPSSLNSACRCCAAPPGTTISLEYVSVEQSCSASGTCGFEPCTSTDAIYDGEGNCVAPAQICSPNYADLSRAEKCAGKLYLTKTTTAQDGHTETTTCTVTEEGGCDCETTCSGSYTVTNTTSGSYSRTFSDFQSALAAGQTQCGGDSGSIEATEETTTTYNEDCTTSSEVVCSGTSSASSDRYECFEGDDLFPNSLECNSDAAADCTWSGTIADTVDDDTDTRDITQPCTDTGVWAGPAPEITSVQVPEVACSITKSFSGPNEANDCNPKTLPSYPAFIDCTPEDEEPPELPDLEPGQGYGSEAYKFTNPNNPALKSETKVKFRVAHGPSGTCYLKVWFRKVLQDYRWEDCDTGFGGDWGVDCDESPCANRWSPEGEAKVEEFGAYEWEGTGYPCFEDLDKPPGSCENRIYGGEKELTAGENQKVTVEIKWSLVKDYEPNWPVDGCQGCKPNGFPIPNPADCPVCAEVEEANEGE